MKSQTFGERIKDLREQHGYSLKYVSMKIQYNASSLSKIEKNKLVAPEKIIKPLSIVLKINYKELIVKYLSEKVYYQIKDSIYAEEVLTIVEKRIRKEGRGTQIVKKREDVIQLIKLYFDNKPIEKAWLFGSFARNTDISYDSDIDILVQFKKPNKITLFDIVNMRNELMERTGREIDLVEKGQELKMMNEGIQKEKVLVYAR